MIWQDRERTDPTKRKFIDENGNEQNVNIEEIESNITQSGTPVNATTMNNIEKNLGTYGNDTYDSTATYSIGDVVTHNALLYRAKQDIETPEEWTAAHWEETSALDELKKTSGNEVLISDDEGDITYQTKIFVDSDTGTAKYRDTDDNFVPLKDNEVIISDTEPTSTDNEIWVDTSSNATYINQEVNIGATSNNNTKVWLKTGKNLFNKNAILENLELQGQTGKISYSTSFFVSEYIEIEPSTDYYISGKTSGSSNCFYDENYNFISTTGGVATGKITTPATARFLRINGLLSEKNNNIQIEKGDTQTTYEAYIEPTINTYSNLYRQMMTGLIRNLGNVADIVTKDEWTQILYKNGISVAYACRTFTGLNFNEAWGNMYLSSQIDFTNFPIKFKTRPQVFLQSIAGATGFAVLWSSSYFTNEVLGGVRLARATATTGTASEISAMVIGNWK